jgi:hypothetical protein
MVLLVMLFGRGGGGRSHAMGVPERVPAAAPVITMPVTPPPAPALAQPAAAAAPEIVPAAAPVPALEAAAPAQKSEPAGASSEVEATPRRSSRSRVRAERDRITRGLSIDPFADAQRGSK